MLETSTQKMELKASEDDGTFQGFATTFNNVDLERDIILPGAFKNIRTTKKGRIRLAMYHDLSRLAGDAEYQITDEGIELTGHLELGVSYVRDAYPLMKSGVLDAMSIGFDILPGGAEFSEDEDGPLRIISKADLWETSIVPFGMNPEALIESVKTLVKEEPREFERFLRKHGFTRREAMLVTSGGLGALLSDPGESSSSQSDSGEMNSKQLAAFSKVIGAFSIK